MSAVLAPRLSAAPSNGGRLVTADGRALPFLGGSLEVDAAGGLARIVLRQTFRNPHAQPLRVTYQVPLPSDAATSGYAFELDGARVVGAVEGRKAARERFEQAMVEGRTAALLEQDRSSLFTQEVGNIPAGAEVVCELVLDQTLVWSSGSWEWRFPTVVAPRFLGEPGRVTDGDRVTVDVLDRPTTPRMTLALTVRDTRTGDVRSPSHPLHVEGARVSLGRQGAALDRDIVVRWPVAARTPGATLDVARGAGEAGEHAYGLLTLVPPAEAGPSASRDLILLLDTSGSMGGRPLGQAKEVVLALIDTLGAEDTLEMIEFSNQPRRWGRKPAKATEKTKAKAAAWVRGLSACGGTYMRDGILAALQGVRAESSRQVVLVTDGLIGFEEEIVAEVVERLPPGSRVHTLGIGSSTNRSLLTSVARAGGGIEAIVGLDEDPREAAEALVAATDAPQVVDLEVSGGALVATARAQSPDLMAGRPARLSLQLRPEGGALTVRGRGLHGAWEQRLRVAPTDVGDGSRAVVTRFGRERVADLEMRGATGAKVDADIEACGLTFQIATRLTSWIAVGAIGVDPGEPTKQERIAQALPHGMSAEGLGLRAPSPVSWGRLGGAASLTLSAPPAPAAPMPGRAQASAPAGAGGFDEEVDLLAEDLMQAEPAPRRSRRSRPRKKAEVERAAPKSRAAGGLFRRLRSLFEPVAYEADLVLATDVFVFTFAMRRGTWALPTSVRLHLNDGSVVEVDVREQGSTRSGDAEGRVRLIVEAGGIDPAAIERIGFAVGRAEVELAVVDARA